jgi:hypothetical protein
MWLDDDDYIDVNTGKDRARAIPFVGKSVDNSAKLAGQGHSPRAPPPPRVIFIARFVELAASVSRYPHHRQQALQGCPPGPSWFQGRDAF